MNKILKTILITSAIVFGLGLFGAPSAKATEVGELIVQWSINGIDWQSLSGPIFNETNFLPADGVSRLIRATNNTAGTLKIGTKGIDNSSCFGFCLADQLKLKITDESSNTLYEDSLTNFFGEEEVELSDVVSDATAIYNFTITFLPESGNDYKKTNVSFNLIVGALGTESISGEAISGGGSSGGGFFIPGLQISNENASGIESGQATITWQTNKGATSRVIFSSQFQPHILQLDNPPNYSYASSTEEYPGPTTNHQIIITGLEPATTYYFRCVSRGSFAVSAEHSFTTPGTRKTEEGESISPSESGEETFVYRGTEPGSAEAGEEIVVDGEELQGEEPKGGLEKLLAAVGSFFNLQNSWWILIIIIVILIVLFFLSRKKKKKE